MILNGFPVDPDRLKIAILSAPKTGNTWLRWLLHYTYEIPIVELPLEWAPGCADDFPARFVTHQHLFPSENLVRWLVESRVVVLTTIRHPAATFLSFFHYVKWHDAGLDPTAAMLKEDGDRPGKNALTYINYSFPLIYAISLAWAKLGSHVVRYEDLLVDPLSQLREVTYKIVPLDEGRLKAAVLLCKPEHLTRPGLVDPLHLRTRSARRWVQELPSEIVDALANSQAYASACKMYGYDWSRCALEPSGYDYDKIDPFRGRDRFDNGELIGPMLVKIYLYHVPNASARWPEPWVTEGESFWHWLRAPSPLASLNPDLPAGTLTNIMVTLHNLRPDLQSAFKNPAGSDRMKFVMWFLGQAAFGIPWGLIEPVFQSFSDYLNSMSDGTFPPASTTRRPNGKEIESTHATSRVQVFAPRYGTYTENHSNTAEIPIGVWHRVRVDLPWSLGDRSGGLRLDPGNEVAIIDIAGILLQSKLTGKIVWRARGPAELSNLTVGGTAIALPDERLFRIFSFGEDPQVIIPRLSGPQFAVPLRLEAWVHFERSVQAIGRAMAAFYSYHSKAQQELQEELESTRHKELSAIRRELESTQRRAWDYKAYRADLTTRLKDRDRRIQEIERSLAWKITKPFWKLERHFKRTPEQIAAAGQLVFALDGPGTWNASYDVCTLKGWCYSLRGPQIVGVRAKVGRKSYFARYGIKREPVAQTAPNHPPALYSGFSVDVPVPEGTLSIRLEGIAQGSTWECFLEHPVPPRTGQPQVPARGDGSVQSTGAFALTAISIVFETSSSFFA